MANDLFTFKFQIVAAKILSLNFLLFLILLPLPIAIMAGFAKRSDKTVLILISLIASMPAIIIAMALFPNMQTLWIPIAACIVSIPLAIETSFIKYSELKSWVTMRTMLAAMGRTIMLISIGLIVLSAVIILPNQEQYVDKFEDFIEDFTSNFTGDKTQNNISGQAAKQVIEAQKELVNQVLETPSFVKLKEKDDIDVMAFVLQAEATKSFINGPEYRAEMERRFQDATRTVIQEMDIIGTMKKEFPLFQTFEDLLWIMQALTIIAFFSMAATIICKPAAIVYGMITESIFYLFEKPQTKPEKKA